MLDDLTPYMKDETVVRQALEAYTKGLATGRLEGSSKSGSGDGKSGGKFHTKLKNMSIVAQIIVFVAIVYLVFNNFNIVNRG